MLIGSLTTLLQVRGFVTPQIIRWCGEVEVGQTQVA